MRAMVVSDFTPGGHGTQQRRGFCLLDELTSCGLTPRLICRSDTAAQVGRSLARVTRDVRWCEGAKVLGFAAAHAGTPGWLLVPEDVIASAAQWGLEADVWCALGPWSAAVLEAAAERLGHRPDLWITDLGRPGSVTLQRRGGVTAKGRVALLRESEQRAAGLSDLTLVECRADAAELGLLERGPWWAVGNGYAVSGDPEAGAMARLRPRLLLAADEGSPEQVKAVVQAVRLVLPLVRRSVADAEVVAAGVRLPRAWRKLAKLPGVDLVELDPMRPTVAWRTLAQSAVAGLAVGKRRGGETSRILGLMAEGRPVVGDPALRAGLVDAVGETLIDAQGAWQMAEAATKLLQRRSEAESAGWCSYQAVREHASWVSQWRVLGSLLRRAAEGQTLEFTRPGHEGEPVLAGRTSGLVHLGS